MSEYRYLMKCVWMVNNDHNRNDKKKLQNYELYKLSVT